MIAATEIVDVVRGIAGDADFVGLHVPSITEHEKKRVLQCLDSTFVSSVGAFVDLLERGIADYTGAKHAVAVSNGTSALQIALLLAGVRPGDDVIVPTLSFVATANAVEHADAVPYFIDSDPITLGMSAAELGKVLDAAKQTSEGLINGETGRRIGAIVPMHTLGHPVAIADVVRLADAYGVPVVEDAAESLGSWVGEQHTGTFGRVGILSFNGNKIMTTGGGGMILTNQEDLAVRGRHLTTTAKLPHRWEFEHDEIGFNYRMPNLNAALGVAQLERLPQFLADKHTVAKRYADAFADVGGVRFLAEPPGTFSNYWLCGIQIDGDIHQRDKLLTALNDAGLQCRPFWNLLADQRAYRGLPHPPTPVAERLHASVICLPSSPALATL